MSGQWNGKGVVSLPIFYLPKLTTKIRSVMVFIHQLERRYLLGLRSGDMVIYNHLKKRNVPIEGFLQSDVRRYYVRFSSVFISWRDSLKSFGEDQVFWYSFDERLYRWNRRRVVGHLLLVTKTRVVTSITLVIL